VRLTVLGKSPAWEDAGGACSGYLVEQGDYTLLIDCGNGVVGKLRERIACDELDQILISHIHADHVLDLVPLGYALTLDRPSGAAPEQVRLALPPGGSEALRRLVAVWGSDRLIDSAFAPADYETGGGLELGPLRVRLHEVPHFTLTHAIELIAPSGGRLVYGADCRSNERLERAARGAEVLLAEATLRDADDEAGPPERRGHMSAAEAAELAERAGVGRLVLTHFSDSLDPGRILAEAEARFSGAVELAATGSSWEL
jgi:ribonuclease BN (tRNA processing enzyme)